MAGRAEGSGWKATVEARGVVVVNEPDDPNR
jgi:hypothetical protein